MALRFKVLERFSRAALEDAASRSYKVREQDGYVCEQGDCVMAVMLRHDGRNIHPSAKRPSPVYIANLLGVYAEDTDSDALIGELVEITRLNDLGKLTTTEAVRALLLGEEAR